MHKPLVLAIDGPAASGKGTLARRLAAHYRLPHLDTGLLYRATARAVLDAGGTLSDVEAATRAAERLDPLALDESRLRGAEMGDAASIVAAMPSVRAALTDFQRAFAGQASGAVLDGRDIGTFICPDATVKLFVTARPEVRAARRHRELSATGHAPPFETVLADIRRRDARDSGRPNVPLAQAPDALLIDTSELDADAAFAMALALIEARRAA